MTIDVAAMQSNTSQQSNTIPTPIDPQVVKRVPSSDPTPQVNERGVGQDPDRFTDDAFDEDLTPYFHVDAWPQPAWLLTEVNHSVMQFRERDYEDYVLNNLRWRYLRLELDFRSSLNSFYNSPYFDKVIGGRIVAFLGVARSALELKSGDPYNATSLLDLIDENMVWLYPPHYVKETASSMISDLKAQKNIWGSYLETEMGRPDQTLGGLRSAIETVKEKLNQSDRDTEVNSGLQIDRLKMLIIAGIVVLIILLIGLPLFLKEDSPVVVYMFNKFGRYENIYKPWIFVLCTSLVGTIAAFLSGLLQIRRSQVKIGEYRESIIQFQLRPILGAIIASFVGVLILWDGLGIEVKNMGVYLLIAFSCGFSERYFLSLLKINDGDNATGNSNTQSVPVSINTSVQSSDTTNARGIPPMSSHRASDDSGDVNTRKL